ncbi:MAG: hypothetical protein EPO52_17540 [Herbiconiux sp.]|uniref:hypothetical protein n=1 Tax=Herbiconiux sp. TaxID=1871186 RepID=UPI0012174BB9|nr:hypothetical protein [Herbiconiux sp.]TAJ46336.1 MAG: hypothetical protein EPO52_17540 [Herbiconiux sp.]
MSPSEKVARRHVEYPDDGVDEGTAWVFYGIAYLRPDVEEINVLPALGCSVREERSLFLAVIASRNDRDLTEWEGEFPRPAGTAQSASYGARFNVIRCRVPGCRQYQQWHRADVNFTLLDEQHVAESASGDGYTVQLVFDRGAWVPQVKLDQRVNGKPLTARQAADLSNDISWLLAESARINTPKEKVA